MAQNPRMRRKKVTKPDKLPKIADAIRRPGPSRDLRREFGVGGGAGRSRVHSCFGGGGPGGGGGGDTTSLSIGRASSAPTHIGVARPLKARRSAEGAARRARQPDLPALGHPRQHAQSMALVTATVNSKGRGRGRRSLRQRRRGARRRRRRRGGAPLDCAASDQRGKKKAPILQRLCTDCVAAPSQPSKARCAAALPRRSAAVHRPPGRT